MKREIVIEQLLSVKQQLTNKFGVVSLTLFGSLARDEATESSDVDLLVEFSGVLTYDRYIQTKFFLEDFLGCPVDLVMPETLKPAIRPQVEKEALRVA